LQTAAKRREYAASSKVVGMLTVFARRTEYGLTFAAAPRYG